MARKKEENTQKEVIKIEGEQITETLKQTKLLEELKQLRNPEDFICVSTGDIHATGVIPECRLDNYPETLLLKVTEIVEFANLINADCILIPGDLFDSADTSKAVVRRLGKVLKRAKCPIFIVVGNHDIYGGNPSTFIRCGAGLLDGFDVVRVIQDNEVFIQKKGNLTIQITGTPYHYNIDYETPEQNYCVKKQEGVTHAIHMVHGYLTDKPLAFKHTLIDAIKDMTEADITVGGHLHIPYFIQYLNKYFINSGGIGRDTAAKSDFVRYPHIHVSIIKQSGEIQISPYFLQTARPASEVIDRTHLVEDEIYKLTVNSLISNMQKIKNQQTLDLREIIRTIAESEEIDEEIRNYALLELSNAEVITGKEEKLNYKNPGPIDSMVIQNFQSHSDTRFKFARRITSIIGESDNGKTAIFRAHRLIKDNKPDGIKYIKRGTKKTVITERYESGLEVTRTRSKTINEYVVQKPNEAEYKENDFGTVVPKKVKEELGYKPLEVILNAEKNDILQLDLNYRSQLEGPFLLKERGSVKAKIIDTIAGIDVIGVAIDNVNRDVSRLNLENISLEKSVEEKDTQLKEYEYLEGLKSNMDQLQELIKKVEIVEKRKEIALQLFEELKQIRKEKEHTIAVIENLSRLSEAELKIQKAMLIEQKKQLILVHVDEYKNILQEKQECKNILNHKENIIRAENLISDMVCIRTTRVQIQELKQQYDTIKLEKETALKVVNSLSNLSTAETKINQLTTVFRKRNSIETLFEEYKKTKSDKLKEEKIVNYLKNLPLAEEKIKQAINSINKRNVLTKHLEELNVCRDSIIKGKDFCKETQQQIDESKQKYIKILETHKVCPLCFSDITEDGHIEHIIKNL